MMTQALILKIAHSVATLTLNKPEVHNAFDDSLILEITQTLKQLEKNESVRVVVLTSSGKHFSAGADLNWMKRMASLTQEQNKQDAQQLAELMYTLNSLSKPTIALVDGATYGGAVGLIACCDIALATKHSQFCLSEVKIGLSPAVISPFVIRAIGERQARRLFLTAEVFDSADAKSIGLLHDTAEEKSDLNLLANKIIKQLLANSPQSLQKTKRLIQHVSQQPINETIRNHTVDVIADIRVSQEGQEGLTAFLEKRQAKWVVNYDA